MKLKKCPCCGSEAELQTVPDLVEEQNAGGQYVQCSNPECGLTTLIMFSCGEDCRPLLAERWNRRDKR